MRILSPFDNLVIQRQRGREVFGFDYQIECYLPQTRREFGYFCLPLLYRDRFVGRIDCKAHRKSGFFEVKTRHIENRIDGEFENAYADALREFAEFNGCQRIEGD